MAQVLTHPRAQSKFQERVGTLGKRLAAVAVSYEVVTYLLATVQAAGLTLPTMVHGGPALLKVECRRGEAAILSAAQKWQNCHHSEQRLPLMSDLKPFLSTIPQCPDGGHYQMVYPGGQAIVDGQEIIVPEGRLAVKCVHDLDAGEDHEAMMSNPYN